MAEGECSSEPSSIADEKNTMIVSSMEPSTAARRSVT
jgi:hypothetical protein